MACAVSFGIPTNSAYLTCIKQLLSELCIGISEPKCLRQMRVVEMAQADIASHGLFHMENAGGCKPAEPVTTSSSAVNEHQASCFALEEEKGEGWKGSGSTKPIINEVRPRL